MRKCLAALVVGSFLLTGCVSNWTVKTTDNAKPILNFTTGDGTYENYTAIGRYNRTGLGVGLGIFTCMLMDLTKITTESLIEGIAKDASEAGANGVINANVSPVRFYGMIIGFYSTSVEGTAIKTTK